MSACDTVFHITELAEAIFLELSISTLLCNVQRTCRHWKAVVDESTRLQQALFFKSISWYPEDRSKQYSPNVADRTYHAAVEHPLLTKIGSGGRTLARAFELNLDAVLRPEASWRRCLVTQPLVTQVCAYTSDEVIGVREIVNDSGIRLGELMWDEYTIRSLHASHIYAWVQWRKSSFSFGYYQLLEQIQERNAALRRLGLA